MVIAMLKKDLAEVEDSLFCPGATVKDRGRLDRLVGSLIQGVEVKGVLMDIYADAESCFTHNVRPPWLNLSKEDTGCPREPGRSTASWFIRTQAAPCNRTGTICVLEEPPGMGNNPDIYRGTRQSRGNKGVQEHPITSGHRIIIPGTPKICKIYYTRG